VGQRKNVRRRSDGGGLDRGAALTLKRSRMETLLVGITALAAGFMNAIAGGGTFLTFPALTGVARLSEKLANVTSTIGLWPGTVTSVAAARGELSKIRRGVIVGYSAVGLAGGVMGAVLLFYTPPDAFRFMVPWLLLFATVVFGMGNRIRRWAGRGESPVEPDFRGRTIPLLLIISVYNGYFGAGAGILLMAGLSLAGLHDLRQINALKTVIQTTANASAVAVFAVGSFHQVDWRIAGTMAVTSAIGGFIGMTAATRIPQAWVRGIVLVIGGTLSVVYFVRAYG
jgi:uncharacterized membrane protein YfcA